MWEDNRLNGKVSGSFVSSCPRFFCCFFALCLTFYRVRSRVGGGGGGGGGGMGGVDGVP